ncbi:MAG: cyclic nucleotide-binding domain-containing protein [Candidatus Gracilibacteria bacterium]|nr:cyclic nucleotide-binding domain-containing protein [Candidatus Gracilibacteria bacterium]
MNILDGVKILDYLSQEDRENLSYFCQEKIMQKGEILFKEGDDADAMYILKKGSFEIKKSIEGQEIVLGKVVSEEILGEMALFGDTNKRMATAIALEYTEMVIILSFSIKDLSKKYPLLLSKIKDIINERIIDNKIVETTLN